MGAHEGAMTGWYLVPVGTTITAEEMETRRVSDRRLIGV